MEIIPQICKETGVSMDYANKFNSKIALLEFDGGIKDLAEGFRKHPIPKYEELFPLDKLDKYAEVTNDGNRERIASLDHLVEDANSRMADPAKFTIGDFKMMINQVYFLIYGSSHPNWPIYKDVDITPQTTQQKPL